MNKIRYSSIINLDIKIKIFILISRFIMLEYLILFIFIGLLFFPLRMTPLAIFVELALIIYASYKSVLIGLFGALTFIMNMTAQPLPRSSPDEVPLVILSEKLTPQDSNRVAFSKSNGSSYVPNETYTAFNV